MLAFILKCIKTEYIKLMYYKYFVYILFCWGMTSHMELLMVG